MKTLLTGLAVVSLGMSLAATATAQDRHERTKDTRPGGSQRPSPGYSSPVWGQPTEYIPQRTGCYTPIPHVPDCLPPQQYPPHKCHEYPPVYYPPVQPHGHCGEPEYPKRRYYPVPDCLPPQQYPPHNCNPYPPVKPHCPRYEPNYPATQPEQKWPEEPAKPSDWRYGGKGNGGTGDWKPKEKR